MDYNQYLSTLPNDSIDVIYGRDSFLLLYYQQINPIGTPKDYFQEMVRVLKKGGLLILYAEEAGYPLLGHGFTREERKTLRQIEGRPIESLTGLEYLLRFKRDCKDMTKFGLRKVRQYGFFLKYSLLEAWPVAGGKTQAEWIQPKGRTDPSVIEVYQKI